MYSKIISISVAVCELKEKKPKAIKIIRARKGIIPLRRNAKRKSQYQIYAIRIRIAIDKMIIVYVLTDILKRNKKEQVFQGVIPKNGSILYIIFS